GVTVRQGLGVKNISGDLEEGFAVTTDAGEFQARFVVGAYGKRSPLDRKLGRAFLDSTRPYVGFKAHFEGSIDSEAVELHAFEGGYCGLCPLGQDVATASWLGSDTALRAAGRDPDRMLLRMQQENPALGARMQGLERIPSTSLATSHLFLRPKG